MNLLHQQDWCLPYAMPDRIFIFASAIRIPSGASFQRGLVSTIRRRRATAETWMISFSQIRLYWSFGQFQGIWLHYWISGFFCTIGKGTHFHLGKLPRVVLTAAVAAASPCLPHWPGLPISEAYRSSRKRHSAGYTRRSCRQFRPRQVVLQKRYN